MTTISRKAKAPRAAGVAVFVALAVTLAGCADASPKVHATHAAHAGSVRVAATGSTGSTSGATPTNVAPTTTEPLIASPTLRTTVTAGVPACTGSQLRQSIASAGIGTGHVGEAVIFTNVSSHKCHLNGYPGVAVRYINGSEWNAQRTMSTWFGGAQPTSSGLGSPPGYPSPPTVDLAPGAAASATVAWTDVTPDLEWPCQNLNYPMMLITAPNTKTTVTYWATPSHQAISGTVGGFSCETLQVTPVIPGTAGSVPN